MIKFFRSIRQSLIMDNQTSRYIKYAIGEIVLVVIGILIALQLNNLNDDRKNTAEELFILNSLNDNLQSALKQSDYQMSVEKANVSRLIGVLGWSKDGTYINLDTISDSTFSKALWNIGPDIPILNTYTNLKNNNKIGLIRNQEITEKFTLLERSLEELKGMLDDRLIVHQTRIDDIAENDINFVRFLKLELKEIDISQEPINDYGSLLKNQRIRNLLSIKLRMTLDVVEDRESLNKEITDLKNLIEKEINRHR
ncbi:DUF6090 family protein [Aegicerativicinus sediminis]|uniref:DUF6090 family protein n=1 Tax=Aegicerativicinus sediminis TaxID=2893202 RepID=UPI001E37DBE6|nr:DUF6090 family protein [Aegicerativicinus sediminis]